MFSIHIKVQSIVVRLDNIQIISQIIELYKVYKEKNTLFPSLIIS